MKKFFSIVLLLIAATLLMGARAEKFEFSYTPWAGTTYCLTFDGAKVSLTEESSFILFDVEYKDLLPATPVKRVYVSTTGYICFKDFKDNVVASFYCNADGSNIELTYRNPGVISDKVSFTATTYKFPEIATEFNKMKKWIGEHGRNFTQSTSKPSQPAPKSSQTTPKPSQSAPKPAVQQPAKLEASIPFIQALPPAKGQSKMYVNYTLKSNSDNLRRRLFVWDIKGQKYLLNPSTGQQLMEEKTGTVGGEKQQLVLDLSKLPAASPSNPFVFTICVYINDPSLKNELAKKFVGTYRWDGSQITYNPSN